VCDSKPMNQKDKNLLRTYVRDVSKVAEELRAAEAAAKSDREAAGWYRDKAEILEFVNADVLDTIDRL
jgi:chromosome condensin MukBEF complex kleisin-like MukF subunit